jgi:hypothetical protein
MCRRAPDLPPVPTLVTKGQEPEGLCTLVAKWPVQDLSLKNLIAAAGGMIDAP